MTTTKGESRNKDIMQMFKRSFKYATVISNYSVPANVYIYKYKIIL